MMPISLPLPNIPNNNNTMYASYDWLGFVAKFGVVPPAFDESRPIQWFFDSSWNAGTPFTGVHFNPGTGNFDPITIPGSQMLTVNVLSPEQLSTNAHNSTPTTPIPSYPLGPGQIVKEGAPGFFVIVTSSPGPVPNPTPGPDTGTLTQTQRDAILMEILQVVSGKNG